MNVYLLNDEQISALVALNSQSAFLVVCDHGLGPCVGEHDFDPTAFADHKALLDTYGLSLTEVPSQEQPA